VRANSETDRQTDRQTHLVQVASRGVGDDEKLVLIQLCSTKHLRVQLRASADNVTLLLAFAAVVVRYRLHAGPTAANPPHAAAAADGQTGGHTDGQRVVT